MMPEELKIKQMTELWQTYHAKKLQEKEAKKKVNKKYYVKRNPKIPMEETTAWQKRNPKRYLKYRILKKWRDEGIKDESLDDLYSCYISQRRCWVCDCYFNNNFWARTRTLYIDKDGEPGLVLCNYCKTDNDLLFIQTTN